MRVPRQVILSGYRWFVLRVEGSYEKRAATTLKTYGSEGTIPDFDLVRRVWAPYTILKTQSSGGITKYRRTSTLPGYLLVEAILTAPLYAAFRRPQLPHVFGWLRSEGCWPSQITTSEVESLRIRETFNILEPADPIVRLVIGDVVEIPTLGLSGIVLEASSIRIVVQVGFFNQNVPVEIKPALFSSIIKTS